MKKKNNIYGFSILLIPNPVPLPAGDRVLLFGILAGGGTHKDNKVQKGGHALLFLKPENCLQKSSLANLIDNRVVFIRESIGDRQVIGKEFFIDREIRLAPQVIID